MRQQVPDHRTSRGRSGLGLILVPRVTFSLRPHVGEGHRRSLGSLIRALIPLTGPPRDPTTPKKPQLLTAPSRG